MILSVFHLVAAPPRKALRVPAVKWAARMESPLAKQLRLMFCASCAFSRLLQGSQCSPAATRFRSPPLEERGEEPAPQGGPLGQSERRIHPAARGSRQSEGRSPNRPGFGFGIRASDFGFPAPPDHQRLANAPTGGCKPSMLAAFQRGIIRVALGTRSEKSLRHRHVERRVQSEPPRQVRVGDKELSKCDRIRLPGR